MQMKIFLLLIHLFLSLTIDILIDNDQLKSNKKIYNSIASAIEQNLNESYLSLELRNFVTIENDIKIFQKSIDILYFIQFISI